MHKDEFRNLEVGDRVRHVFTEATIEWIEWEWNYDVSPPVKVPWAIHLDNGTNLRVSDCWLGEVQAIKQAPEPRSHFECKCGEPDCNNRGWINVEEEFIYIITEGAGTLITLDAEEIDAMIARLQYARDQIKE